MMVVVVVVVDDANKEEATSANCSMVSRRLLRGGIKLLSPPSPSVLCPTNIYLLL